MAILKQCSWHGCTKIVSIDVKYCQYHANKFDKQEKERYKEYSARRRRDDKQKKYQDFYSNKDWQRIRDVCIADCYGIDILEYYRTGRIIQGERVHHIVELNDDWECRLDVGNLIYLTEQNHRRIHSEYDKGDKEKALMQRVLFELIKKFNSEFC